MWRLVLWLGLVAALFICVASRPGGGQDYIHSSPILQMMSRVLSNDYTNGEDLKQLCSLMHAIEITAKVLRDVIEKKGGSISQTCAAFEPFDVLTSRTPKSFLNGRRLLL